jgi:GNAT superfamily N-acetyltransferase
MATPVIRDLVATDLDWCADLKSAWDQIFTRDEWRRAFSGEIAPIEVIRVAVDGDERLGVAAIIHPINVPYPQCDVHVAPQHQGRGVGSALFAELRPLLEHRTCGAGMVDKDPRAVAVAQAWGFEVISHGIDSRLALAPGGPAPAVPDGTLLRVVAAAEVAADGVDLDGMIAQAGDYPEAELLGYATTNAGLMAAAPDLLWFLLEDDQGLLAASGAVPRPEGDWYVMFSVTAPRARGRGLARAAKEQLHHWAAEHGAPGVQTTNDVSNARIRALNASMGYVPISGDVRLLRRPPGGEA